MGTGDKNTPLETMGASFPHADTHAGVVLIAAVTTVPATAAENAMVLV